MGLSKGIASVTAHDEGRAESDAPAQDGGPRVLRPYRFSTADLPPTDRFEAWREHLRPVADLRPSTTRGVRGVDLAMWILQLPRFARSEIRAPSSRDRQSAFAPRMPHHGTVLLQPGANWTGSSNGGAGERVSQGAASQLGLYSLGEAAAARPARHRDADAVHPAGSFGAGGGDTRTAPSNIDDPRRRWVGSWPIIRWRWNAACRPARAGSARRRLRHVVTIAACLSPSRDGLRETESGMVIGLRERARRIVRARLGDRTLTPAGFGEAMACPRSVLYRLFEPQGGVARYIQRCRLAAASEALSNPNDTRRTSPWPSPMRSAFRCPGVQPSFRSQFG